MPLQPARFKTLMTALVRRSSFWILLFCAGVSSAMLASADLRADESTNGVVAVVNAEPITFKTLADEALLRYGSDQLESMVNRYLILQACKEQGITITQGDVEAEITRVAKKFRLSVENYLALLQEERNISPNRYGREIIWPMLALRRLVSDKIEITEEEFNKAFIAQYGEAIKCRMIMLADHEKAESLRQQAVAQPESFSELAKQHSEDETSASMGGLIPPIRRHTGDASLEEAAFSLSDGGISPVLPLGDQWIILQAVRRIPATQLAPQAMPVVKEQIRDRLRDQKMQGAASQLFSELQARSEVVTVLGDEQASQKHPGVAAIINGQKLTLAAVAQECVKHHGSEVLEGEIHRKLLTQALRHAKKQVTDADLQEEIATAAIRYGYVQGDGNADVEAWMESVTGDGKTTREIYIRDAVWPSVALRKLVEGTVSLTEQDIQEGFEASFGPRVEVLAVVLSDQRSAQKVWELARANPTDHFFGQLASQYSVEPVSSSNFGKVPPIQKHSGQPAIEREAFKLKPGDLSGIIATGDKYIILRCQGFTDPVVTDLEDVREELVQDLEEQKLTLTMASRFEKIKETAEIENFLEAAQKLPISKEQAAAISGRTVPAKR